MCGGCTFTSVRSEKQTDRQTNKWQNLYFVFSWCSFRSGSVARSSAHRPTSSAINRCGELVSAVHLQYCFLAVTTAPTCCCASVADGIGSNGGSVSLLAGEISSLRKNSFLHYLLLLTLLLLQRYSAQMAPWPDGTPFFTAFFAGAVLQ